MAVLLKCSVCGKLRRVRLLSDRGNICVACRRSLDRAESAPTDSTPEAQQERIQTRNAEFRRHIAESAASNVPDSIEQQRERFSLSEPKELVRDKRLDKEWLEYTRQEIGPIGRYLFVFGIAQCALGFGLIISAMVHGSPSAQETQEKLALGGATIFLASISILGSIAMIKVKLWHAAVAGCVASMIPVSFCWVAGFFLGLWALFELGQTEIKATFARNGKV